MDKNNKNYDEDEFIEYDENNDYDENEYEIIEIEEGEEDFAEYEEYDARGRWPQPHPHR